MLMRTNGWRTQALVNVQGAASRAMSVFRTAGQEVLGGESYLTGPDLESYVVRWALYKGSIFDDVAFWASFRFRMGLYRDTRAYYNPFGRLVRMYAGLLYPGVLSIDGRNLPDGTPVAMPLDPSLNDDLKAAIAVLWRWNSFSVLKSKLVRWTGSLGDCLGELMDDPVRGKVWMRLVWPEDVAEVTLDDQGHVRAYALEYPTEDEDGESFMYRKEVTAEGVTTYKNGEKWGFNGQPAQYALDYGFCPAVWFMHEDDGSGHGDPVLAGSMGKMFRLMSYASHLHDQVHRVIGAPKVLFTDGQIGNRTLQPITGGQIIKKRDGREVLATDPESILLLRAPAGGSIDDLSGDLDIAGAAKLMEMDIEDIQQDQPLLIVMNKLREMSQTTGPSIRQLTVDATAPLYDAANHYDPRLIEAYQMLISMAAMRVRDRKGKGWRGTLSADQSVFQKFSVESYQQGDLNFEILPRSIVPSTLQELLENEVKRYQVLQAGQQAHIPLVVVLRRAGWTEKEIKTVQDEQEAAFKKAQEQMQQAMPTQGDTQGTGQPPRNGAQPGTPTPGQAAARAGQGGSPTGGRRNETG